MKPCPTPRKAAYESRRVALMKASRVRRTFGTPVRMRAYKCRCGKWHLTRKGAVEEEIGRLMKRVSG